MRFTAMMIVVSLLAGCGGTGGPGRAPLEKDVVPVNGTLTYQGQPLESFQIAFHPRDGKKPGTGVTDASGNFKLGTNNIADGCPAGSCRVSVAFVAPANDGMGEIVDDPRKLPKPKVNVPAKYASPDTSEIMVDVPNSGLKDYKLDLK